MLSNEELKNIKRLLNILNDVKKVKEQKTILKKY